MTGALALALPGLLCAVLAWDLARPGADRSSPVSLRQLTLAGVLAAAAGLALAAAVVLPLGVPPPAALPNGAGGAVALVLTTRPPATRLAAPRPVDRLRRTAPTPAQLITCKEPA